MLTPYGVCVLKREKKQYQQRNNTKKKQKTINEGEERKMNYKKRKMSMR